MYSMTGYGKGVACADGKTVFVEIKSVNHRYLDWGIKTPRSMLFVEDAIKRTVSEVISRGHIDVFVSLEQQAGSADEYALNEELARKYIAAATALSAMVFSAPDAPSAGQVILQEALRQPDILTRTHSAEDQAALDAQLAALTDAALRQALDGLKAMRLREGEALKADISQKLDNIALSLARIEALAPGVVAAYRQAMRSRIAEVLDPSKVDEQRLATEVALYADHCCIDEEITRLGTHISAMRALLEASEPVGRKMDFLVQEFNREANTIGSKANDSAITAEVLAIKNEIEKLREQAANIE